MNKKQTYQDRFSLSLYPYPNQTWFHNDIKIKLNRMKFHKKVTEMLPRPRQLFRSSLGLGPRKPNEPLEVDSKYIRFSHIKVMTLWAGFPPEIIMNRPEYKLIVDLADHQWLMYASVENIIAWINTCEKLGCVANYIPRVVRCPIWEYRDPELDANGVEINHKRKEHRQAKYDEIKMFVELGYETVDIVSHFPDMIDNTIRYNIRKAKKEIEQNGKTNTKYAIRVV